MPTNIKKIAQISGVSIATVSRAMNNNGPVKEATRQKILRIAEELNYHPNHIARSLSRKKTDTIGVILPELVDEFFMGVIQGIEEVAHRNKQYIFLSSSHSQRNMIETSLEYMSGGRVDGVILMAPSIQNEIGAICKKSKIPIVLLNGSNDLTDITIFNINNFQGARTAVKHLIDHGYKNIGMIKGPDDNSDAIERYRGYCAALKEADRKLDSSLIITGDFSVKSGYHAFTRVITNPIKPDALFIANDMMALGVYEAARLSKYKIPEDIAVAGFDDIFISRLLVPRLTTVHVPIVELGKKAMTQLLFMINNGNGSTIHKREELSAGLVIGGSCGCSDFAISNII